MKFLLDQDVYLATARFLKQLGHDVVSAYEIGLSRADDSELLNVAHKNEQILVTRDRDYGNLVFVKNLGAGVIYLRILPSTLSVVHRELEKVLASYSENELREGFVTVEAWRYRFRKVSQREQK
jgi:predicted nuclease of predicted toxin-antitoxin system